MENIDKKCGCSACQAGGSCGGAQPMCGGHGCCGKHHLVKMILKIFIVILIFWCGFTLGQEAGFIKATYGREMMRGGYQQYGMMQSGGWNNDSLNNIPPTAAPVITPAPTAK
jgi:hypothetical protein